MVFYIYGVNRFKIKYRPIGDVFDFLFDFAQSPPGERVGLSLVDFIRIYY